MLTIESLFGKKEIEFLLDHGMTSEDRKRMHELIDMNFNNRMIDFNQHKKLTRDLADLYFDRTENRKNRLDDE